MSKGLPTAVPRTEYRLLSTRYRALARNRAQIITLFGLGNLVPGATEPDDVRMSLPIVDKNAALAVTKPQKNGRQMSSSRLQRRSCRRLGVAEGVNLTFPQSVGHDLIFVSAETAAGHLALLVASLPSFLSAGNWPKV